MKVDLTKQELWALIGTVDGVWEIEQTEEQKSAREKLEKAYVRVSQRGEPKR